MMTSLGEKFAGGLPLQRLGQPVRQGVKYPLFSRQIRKE